MSNLPLFPASITTPSTKLITANGTSVISLLVAGAAGSILTSLTATSNNAVDLALQLWITNATDNAAATLLGTVAVPALSGTTGALPTVAVLESANLPALPKDAAGNPYLTLASGTTLSVSANVALSAGKELGVFGMGGNF